MIKAFTSSLIGMLVDEGLLSFSTQLQGIFPEFQRQDAQANITIEDLMSHRTGLAPMDNLWFSSYNDILVDRNQAIPIMSYAPVAGPFRSSFNYNNIAYEILGQVLEKVTGLSYADLLRQRIIELLKLNRTFYAGETMDDNTAKSYAALANGLSHELRPSVKDLLSLYKALMEAANSQAWTAAITNPFKQVPELFGGKVGVGSTSLREYSYASGYIMGNAGIVALFLETSTGIVVLGNSILVETTFENDFNATTYTRFAREARDYFVQYVHDRNEELLANKTALAPINPLNAYVGKYYNSINSVFVEIKLNGDKLQVAFLGVDIDTYELHPYQNDSFFWTLSFDESAKRARLPWFPAEYFILKFGCRSEPSWWQFGKEVDMGCLTWKHEFTVSGDGEAFRKEHRGHGPSGVNNAVGSQQPADL
ncbi:beta-lactamase/transpeptidase-like protein [Xylaria venustula]|nr:beta-lactamase/transpeptidase-like protein [Xylaria venustula]